MQDGQVSLGKEMTKLEKEIVSRKAEAASKKSALVMMHRRCVVQSFCLLTDRRVGVS